MARCTDHFLHLTFQYKDQENNNSPRVNISCRSVTVRTKSQFREDVLAPDSSVGGAFARPGSCTGQAVVHKMTNREVVLIDKLIAYGRLFRQYVLLFF